MLLLSSNKYTEERGHISTGGRCEHVLLFLTRCLGNDPSAPRMLATPCYNCVTCCLPFKLCCLFCKVDVMFSHVMWEFVHFWYLIFCYLFVMTAELLHCLPGKYFWWSLSILVQIIRTQLSILKSVFVNRCHMGQIWAITLAQIQTRSILPLYFHSAHLVYSVNGTLNI
jgi:hypothetical protein